MKKPSNALINGEPWIIEDAVMITHTCCDCETLKKRKKRGIKIVHKKKK